MLLFSSSVRSTQLLCLCTIKAKKENKNIQQRILSTFITITLYKLLPEELRKTAGITITDSMELGHFHIFFYKTVLKKQVHWLVKNHVSITWWRHRISTNCWCSEGASKENLHFDNTLFSFFLLWCFQIEIENMYSVFLLSYRNTCESLGELEKAVETLGYSSCSHSISRFPKLPFMFL